MFRRPLTIRAEIVLNLTILMILSILLLSFVVLKVTKDNMVRAETKAAQEALEQLKITAANSPKSRAVEAVLGLARMARFKDPAIYSSKQLEQDDKAMQVFKNFQRRGMQLDATLEDNQYGEAVLGVRRLEAIVYYVPLIGKNEAFIGILKATASLKRLQVAIDKSKQTVFLYTFFFSVIIGLFGYFLLSRTIVAPLDEMARVASEIAEGNHSERIQISSEDEIGTMATAFNVMTEKLVRNQQQLEKHVTSLERLNEELEAAQREVVMKEKLASAGRLAAGLAHEIGNPLGAVLGYVDMLQKGARGKERTDYLSRTEKELSRINAIIRTLLEYAKPQQIEIRSVQVVDVVEDTLQTSLAPDLLEDIKVEKHYEDALPQVRIDAGQLQQVMLNLFINACHSMAEAGGLLEIRIATREAFRHEDGKLKSRKSPSAQKVEAVFVEVKDSGCGIDEEELPRIFDPFYTTKDPGQGTGLGLYISHSIVDAWGGALEAKSASGEGSQFSLIFPVSA